MAEDTALSRPLDLFAGRRPLAGSLFAQATGAYGGLNVVVPSLRTVFSWAVLMPIAVILAGKLLSQQMKLAQASRQLFRVSLWRVLNIEARNDEVIFGFTGFIVTLFFLGSVAGPGAYTFFRERFGVDPGHFNALCVLSSFLLVVWTFLLFVVTRGLEAVRRVRASDEHSALIDKLTDPQRRP